MSNEGTVRLLQLTALGPAASEMLIFLLLARHLVNDSSGVTSSLVYAAGLLGVSIMGLLGGIILRKLTRNALGVLSATGLVASSCIPFLFDAGPLDFFVAFLSSFFFAIANSNTNASISSTISSTRRAQEFSKYQTLTNLLVVSAPLLAAALLANYGAPIAFACVTALHLLAGIPWLIIKIPNAKKSIVEEGLFRQMTTGYRIIVSHAPPENDDWSKDAKQFNLYRRRYFISNNCRPHQHLRRRTGVDRCDDSFQLQNGSNFRRNCRNHLDDASPKDIPTSCKTYDNDWISWNNDYRIGVQCLFSRPRLLYMRNRAVCT